MLKLINGRKWNHHNCFLRQMASTSKSLSQVMQISILTICLPGIVTHAEDIMFQDKFAASLDQTKWFGTGVVEDNHLKIIDDSLVAGNHLISSPINIQKNNQYLLQFECFKDKNNKGNCGGFIIFYDAAGNFLGSKSILADAINEWEVLEIEIDSKEIPENTDHLRIGLQPAQGDAQELGIAYFRNLKFGNTIPSPEDKKTIFSENFKKKNGNWIGIYTLTAEGVKSPGAAMIADRSSSAGDHISSRVIKIDTHKNYRLTGMIKTDGKVTSFSCMYLSFFDAAGKWLGAKESNMVKNDIYERAKIDVLSNDFPVNTDHVRILLQPAAGLPGESGIAWFDDIELKEWTPESVSAFEGNSDKIAYTDPIYIKGSSNYSIYDNPSAFLKDNDSNSFWRPLDSDKTPSLELSYGKNQLPGSVAMMSAANIPSSLTVGFWDDKQEKFIGQQTIATQKHGENIFEIDLQSLPECRKLLITFPDNESAGISELRYFVRIMEQENYQAFWIWEKNQLNLANLEEFTTRAFRRKFKVDGEIATAKIQGRGDDGLKLFVNGKRVATHTELKNWIVQGENVICGEVENERYAAGFLAEFDLIYQNGKELKIVSDKTWKTQKMPLPETWLEIIYDDSNWVFAEETARPPYGPWGEVPYTLNTTKNKIELLNDPVPELIFAGKELILDFDLRLPKKIDKSIPFYLRLSKNNQIFFDEKISEGDFLPKMQPGENHRISYRFNLNQYYYPGEYTIHLYVPFCDITLDGKSWTKNIIIENDRKVKFTSAKMVTAPNGEVKMEINGTPQWSIWYTFPYMAGRKTQQMMAANFFNSAFKIAQIFAGPRIIDEFNCDFTTIDRTIADTLASDPTAYIILKMELNSLYPDFKKKFPEEICTFDNGKLSNYPSHASEKWRTISGNMLRKTVEHIKQGPYADKVIGYFICSGEEGQWFHHWNGSDPEVDGSISDYSPAMEKYFRNFLKEKYQTDQALQVAWADENVSLDNAMIPSRKARVRKNNGVSWRNPQIDRAAIDYAENLSDCVNNAINAYGKIIKEVSGGNSLVFCYYGHIMDVGDGYLAELSGYLKQQELLKSPYVDGFAGPLSYRAEFRDIGGTSSIDFPPSGSTRLHNKMEIQEADLRTHLFPKEYAYTIRLPWQSIAVLSREFAKTICDGAMMYLHEFGTDTRNWFDDTEYLAELKKLNELGEYFIKNKDLSQISEIAVVSSDTTLLYMNPKKRYIQHNNPETRSIYLREKIGRIGAPFTEYLISSLDDEKMPDYKLYIFLNAYYLTEKQQETIIKKLDKNGATALFFYAAGVVNDKSADISNMENMLGMKLKPISSSGSLMMDIKFQYGSKTVQETNGMFEGDTIDYIFTVVDKNAETLGMLPNTKDVVFARKKHSNSMMYFASFPFFSTNVLREVARMANVHIYMDSDDAFYACKDIFAVHTNKLSGLRTINLPEKTKIRQVYPQMKEMGTVEQIKFDSNAPLTNIYEIIRQ